MGVTLWRYLAARFLGALGWSLAATALIVFIGNFVDMLGRGSDGAAGIGLLAAIAALKTPAVALKAAPFIVLLAALAAFARLARGSEIVVTRAAGVSVWALVAPAVLAAALAGGATFAAIDPIAAATASRAETLSARWLSDDDSRLSVSAEGLWLREGDAGGQTVIHARRADGGASTLREVTFFRFDAGGVPVSRTDARVALLRPGAWELRDGVARRLDAPGETPPEPRPFGTLRTPTGLTAEGIVESFEAPEAISFWRLPAFIATLEAAGFSARRHRMHWQRRMALPALFAGMAMIGAAFAMRPARFGGLGAMGVGAVLSGFGLYFVSDLAQALGASGAAPVALAAWAPPAATALAAAGLLLHLEDG